jgi:hypothetical protein
VVPSRGRPGAVHEMAQVFADTCTARTRLVFAVDDDDPVGSEYLREAIGCADIRSDSASTMVEALNKAAAAIANGEEPPYAIAFMGDDHRPRTKGWDSQYLEALRRMGSGLVYGNDLLQGEQLPTQVAMTTDIVRALGWMAPPVLRHMYVDNFWRDLGVHAGCIRYLPEVIVEHVHPVAGKAEMDAGYERVNAEEVYSADLAAYTQFRESGAFRAAVDTVRALFPEDPKRARHIGMARASLVAEAAYITGGKTVADVAPQPTDLRYLLGPALQVQHRTRELAADIVCVSEGVEYWGDALKAGARAAVTSGLPLECLAAAGFTLLRTRTIGDYPVALGVRR